MPRRPPTHRPPRPHQPAAETRSSTALGYDRTWRKLRAVWLNDHPSCERCLEEGRATPATVVDHIRPHKGDQRLLLDDANLMSLCKSCHSRKTATEDGGFGRPVKAHPKPAPPEDPTVGQSWI